MRIYTGTIRGKYDDALDITVKSGSKTFAPTWDMVLGYKHGTMSEEEYTLRYTALMRKSIAEHPTEWKSLMERDSVTLTCYCRPGEFCHRVLLAKLLARHPGVTYEGEH